MGLDSVFRRMKNWIKCAKQPFWFQIYAQFCVWKTGSRFVQSLLKVNGYDFDHDCKGVHSRPSWKVTSGHVLNISGDLYQSGGNCRSSAARTTYNFVRSLWYKSPVPLYHDTSAWLCPSRDIALIRRARSGYKTKKNKLTAGDYSKLLQHYCEIILIVVV